MDMLKSVAGLSQEGHHELMFKLTELQDDLYNFEVKLLNVIELQGELSRQQFADKSEELRESMIKTQHEPESSQITDKLAKQAVVEMMLGTLDKQLEAIRNPPDFLLNAHSTAGSKSPTFTAIAGLVGTMP
jgi:hypothetical protein